ncbi:hypothetical protein FRC10_004097 [Ceratobasidium sp. 414]|nr:hypothetical protein FRC10_004097 [Ceratobasidium sp. 414]
MTYDCTATFVVYALLSSFSAISKKDRDAVRYVLGLLSDYNVATRQLLMTHDVCALARLYLPQLRTMAARHSYVHRGSLKSDSQARALLGVVVTPLIRHLSSTQYQDILASIEDANTLLSLPISILNELVVSWRIQNLELVLNWRSFPVLGTKMYSFGCSGLPGFRVEDVLTPLPYPVTASSRASSIDGTSKALYSLGTKPGGAKTTLIEISRLASSHLSIQRAVSPTDSDSSSVQTLTYAGNGSERELLGGMAVFDLEECSCRENRATCFIHGKGHPSDREHRSIFPSRRKIARYMRSGLKALLTSL